MADHSERSSSAFLDEALSQVRKARTQLDELRLRTASNVASSVVTQHAGRATLREFVFAMHGGVDLEKQPETPADQRLQAAYLLLRKTFSGHPGTPIAKVGRHSTRQGQDAGSRPPLWIGRDPATAFMIKQAGRGESRFYCGLIELSVQDVHLAVRDPLYDNVHVADFSEPGRIKSIGDKTYEFAETHPGKIGFASEIGTQLAGYAIGWDTIMAAGKVENGSVAAQLFLQRVVGVMAAFESPQA